MFLFYDLMIVPKVGYSFARKKDETHNCDISGLIRYSMVHGSKSGQSDKSRHQFPDKKEPH